MADWKITSSFTPSQSDFAVAVAHQSQLGLQGRKFMSSGTKRNFTNFRWIKRFGSYSVRI